MTEIKSASVIFHGNLGDRPDENLRTLFEALHGPTSSKLFQSRPTRGETVHQFFSNVDLAVYGKITHWWPPEDSLFAAAFLASFYGRHERLPAISVFSEGGYVGSLDLQTIWESVKRNPIKSNEEIVLPLFPPYQGTNFLDLRSWGQGPEVNRNRIAAACGLVGITVGEISMRPSHATYRFDSVGELLSQVVSQIESLGISGIASWRQNRFAILLPNNTKATLIALTIVHAMMGYLPTVVKLEINSAQAVDLQTIYLTAQGKIWSNH